MRHQKLFLLTVCSLMQMFTFPVTSGGTNTRTSDGPKRDYQTAQSSKFTLILTWRQSIFPEVLFGPIDGAQLTACSRAVLYPRNRAARDDGL